MDSENATVPVYPPDGATVTVVEPEPPEPEPDDEPIVIVADPVEPAKTASPE